MFIDTAFKFSPHRKDIYIYTCSNQNSYLIHHLVAYLFLTRQLTYTDTWPDFYYEPHLHI